MLVHEFVDGQKPIMVLVHGLLTPWQVWTPQIEAFRERYNIYAIALNAHTEECASEFVSVLEEAEEIIRFFTERGIETIDVLCGISLGGKIGHEIWKSGKLHIRNLVMDGAPLAACPGFAVGIMIHSYKDIIHKSKKRDAGVMKSYRNFLPEQYLNSYLKIADLFTDQSMENIVKTVFAGGKTGVSGSESRVLFIHGTKANEILSKKSAKILKKNYPAAEVVCFRGDAHCHKAIYEPERWTEVVKKFLDGQSCI